MLLAQRLTSLEVIISGNDNSRSSKSVTFLPSHRRTTHPASPWIGSTRKAATCSPCLFSADSSASTSLNGILFPETGQIGPTRSRKGPKPRRDSGSVDMEMIPIVRPAQAHQHPSREKKGTIRRTVEVLLDGQDDSLVLGNSLDLVSPLSRHLHSGFDRFSSSVHRENHLETGELGEELREGTEGGGVECSGRESESRGLLDQSGDDVRVAMSLIHRAVDTNCTSVVVYHRAEQGAYEYAESMSMY